jgi:hypothetical protein
MTADLSEKKESLWMLAASPTVWALHLLLSYCTAAIWCAKIAQPDDSLSPVRWAIAIYTAIALVAVALIGWRGLKRQSLAGSTTAHDFDSREGRHRFLGFATLLLSGLSAVAITYAALAAVFIENCR